MSARTNFIKSLQVGRKLRFEAKWVPPGGVARTVTKVLKTKAAFSHPIDPGRESWLDFPKAAWITEPSPGKFVIVIPQPYGSGETLIYDFNVGAISGLDLRSGDFWKGVGLGAVGALVLKGARS